MGNHYHLFIQSPEANLVEGMKWLQNTVTRRFNVRHREEKADGVSRKDAKTQRGKEDWEKYFMAFLNPLRLSILSEAGVRTDGKLLFDVEGKGRMGSHAKTRRRKGGKRIRRSISRLP